MAKNQTLVQFRVDSDLKNEVSGDIQCIRNGSSYSFQNVYGAQQNGAWNTI